jgi:valyl-tRNA synthetase
MAKIPLYGEDEAAKNMTRSVLAHVLESTMKLLHPFMPFVTEEIWQSLPHQGESITVSAWPTVKEELTNTHASETMKMLVELIRSVRNIRAEVNTPMSKKVPMFIAAKDETIATALEENRSYIERFCNPEELTISTSITAPEKCMTAVISGAELYLPLEGLINLDEEKKRLEKELAKWTSEVERVQKKLSNQGFVAKAPEAVIEEERRKEKDYLEKQEAVKVRLADLSK